VNRPLEQVKAGWPFTLYPPSILNSVIPAVTPLWHDLLHSPPRQIRSNPLKKILNSSPLELSTEAVDNFVDILVNKWAESTDFQG
jgi:hypothetical protein